MRPRAGASSPPRSKPEQRRPPPQPQRSRRADPSGRHARESAGLHPWRRSARLMRGFSRSPACDTTDSTKRDHATAATAATPNCRASSTPPTTPATRAADRARPGLVRAHPRHQLRPADRAPGEIGGDVGQPHDREQKQDRGKAPAPASRRRHDRRDQKRRRIEHARRAPQRRTFEASVATPSDAERDQRDRGADPARRQAAGRATTSATAPRPAPGSGHARRPASPIPTARRAQASAQNSDERPVRRNRRPRPRAAQAQATRATRRTRLLRPAESRAPAVPARPDWRRPRSRSGLGDRARRTGVRAGDIRRSRLPARHGRSRANRSARTRVRCRPPARAGNSTAAARRWCG